MAEETRDPRRTAPWGMVIAVAVSGVVGYMLLIALTLAIRSIPEVLGAKDAQGNAVPAAIAILQTALGAKYGNAMAAFASIAMWFCGLILRHLRIARGLLAGPRPRDAASPASCSASTRNTARPAAAIWAVVVASLAGHGLDRRGAHRHFTQHGRAVSRLRHSRGARLARPLARLALAGAGRMDARPLGRCRSIVSRCSIPLFICFVLIMPPNQLAAKTLGGVLAVLAAIYVFEVRRKYKSPEWAREQAAHNGAAGA